MVSLVIIITWHGNNVYVYARALLFYLHYSNVYDIEIIISTVYYIIKFHLGFCSAPLYNTWKS